MAVTNKQARDFFAVGARKIDSILAYLDKVSPKVEADGTTPRSNTADDLSAHAWRHYEALVVADLKAALPDPEL